MKVFVQFDPRSVSAATDFNEEIFTQYSALGILGVEVTTSALANRCVGNLDHHGPGSTAQTPSACEQALGLETVCSRCGVDWVLHNSDLGLGPGECESEEPAWVTAMCLATVRPDADSVTAMAVIVNRWRQWPIDVELVSAVGRFDRLGPFGGRPDPRVWAIARKARDHKIPLGERVQWVADLLAGDDKSAEVAALVATHDAELAAAHKASEVSTRANGRIACVVSTHRFATTLGYETAPVVVALNPEFPVDPRDLSKGTCRKFTVCRYDSHVSCDLSAALEELQALEPGWGGRGDIFGSPQGVGSTLTVEQVVEVVSRHLK